MEKETSQGVGNLSELMPAKPRMFNDAELRAAAEEKIVLIVNALGTFELIKSLNEFETYSSACSVDNWKDAAIHASIYAYTCQARHDGKGAAVSPRRADLEGGGDALDDARLLSLARVAHRGDPRSCQNQRQTGAKVGISSTLN